VAQGKPYRKAGMSGDWNGDVWFDNVRVPREFRAHRPGTDAKAARAFISSANVGTAAQCIGVMRNIYEILKNWCDTRVVAGKPLKEHTITAGPWPACSSSWYPRRTGARGRLGGPRHSRAALRSA
jgi:alkylation response protein AidB-like acyl-CoA dehydrogenase